MVDVPGRSILTNRTAAVGESTRDSEGVSCNALSFPACCSCQGVLANPAVVN